MSRADRSDLEVLCLTGIQALRPTRPSVFEISDGATRWDPRGALRVFASDSVEGWLTDPAIVSTLSSLFQALARAPLERT